MVLLLSRAGGKVAEKLDEVGNDGAREFLQMADDSVLLFGSQGSLEEGDKEEIDLTGQSNEVGHRV
jgi:hypothetical protein